MRARLVAILVAIQCLTLGSAVAASSNCAAWTGAQFVRLDGGKFQMGADASSIEVENFEDESPRHWVDVPAFCVMRDLLTIEELRSLTRARSAAGFFDMKTLEDQTEPYVKADLPTAKQIAKYLSEVWQTNVRLPTEAEWELAARGGLSGKTFVWGNRNDLFRGRPVKQILLDATLDCRVEDIEEIVGDPSLLACTKAEMEQKKGMLDEYYIGHQYSCLTKRLGQGYSGDPENGFGLRNLMGYWQWTSSLYMKYPYRSNDGREDNLRNMSNLRAIRGGKAGQELCGAWVSLRGYGAPTSKYHLRFAIGFGDVRDREAGESRPTVTQPGSNNTASLGPSFDCEANRQPDESAVCSNAVLAAKDRRMARLFELLRAELPPEQSDQLRMTQREWLRARRECGADTACLQALYDKRLSQLADMLREP